MAPVGCPACTTAGLTAAPMVERTAARKVRRTVAPVGCPACTTAGLTAAPMVELMVALTVELMVALTVVPTGPQTADARY